MVGNRIRKKLPVRCAIFFALLVIAGCGSDEDRPVNPPSIERIEIVADKASDRRIARDFTKYLLRGCTDEIPERAQRRLDNRPNLRRLAEASLELCNGVWEVEVENSRITAKLGPVEDTNPDDLGKAFCSYVRGSDVADPVPGHELLDSTGESVVVCGEVNAYR